MSAADSVLEQRIDSTRKRLLAARNEAARRIISAELQKLIAQRTPAELERVHRETYR